MVIRGCNTRFLYTFFLDTEWNRIWMECSLFFYHDIFIHSRLTYMFVEYVGAGMFGLRDKEMGKFHQSNHDLPWSICHSYKPQSSVSINKLNTFIVIGCTIHSFPDLAFNGALIVSFTSLQHRYLIYIFMFSIDLDVVLWFCKICSLNLSLLFFFVAFNSRLQPWYH